MTAPQRRILAVVPVLIASNADRLQDPWATPQPDPSGCWMADFDFEHCCIPWDKGSIGVGNPSCWTTEFTFERCCLPPKVPRDFLTCQGRGIWEKFRRDMMLGRNFADSHLKLVYKQPIEQCIIGALLAALAHVALLATEYWRYGTLVETTYDRAEKLLKLVLRSPISLHELLASGWPLGAVLATLRLIPWVGERAAYAVAQHEPLKEPTPQTVGVSNLVGLGISNGKRIAADAMLAHLVSSEIQGASAFESAAALATTAWASAVSMKNLDAPRASHEERIQIAEQARGLLGLGDARLRKALLEEPSVPLSRLLSVQQPLVELLQGLQWQSVVIVDPTSILKDTIYFTGVAPALQDAEAHPLEIHVLPKYDSVSNYIRVSRQPFCYDYTFLHIGAWLVKAASASTLQFWEVGANQGDCTLWLAAMFSSESVQQQQAARLKARAFEPMPEAAAVAKRSAAALLDANRLRLQQAEGIATARLLHTDHVSIEVSELALGDKLRMAKLGLPKKSLAESTLYSCQQRYGNHTSCEDVQVKMETIDRLLIPDESGTLSSSPPYEHWHNLDLMKIHVQGFEPAVLRGARQSLASGRICVVLVRLSSVALSSARATKLGEEIWALLSGLQVLLVTPSDGSVSRLGSGAELGRLVGRIRQNEETFPGFTVYDNKGRKQGHPADKQLVAWHDSTVCRRSPAVAAVNALWHSTL